MTFDPNARATEDSGIFGLPYSADDSQLVILPVPWEATTSYGSGTSLGPQAVLEASYQVDLFDLETGKAYEKGYHLLDISTNWLEKNQKAKSLAEQIRNMEENSKEAQNLQEQVNQMSNELNEWVYQQTKKVTDSGKLVALLGGDHSTPFGIMRTLGEKYNGHYGILHIDAHHDFRKAYEGFKWSHASIMYNVMESPFRPSHMTQVGIRDFCEEEFLYAKEKNVRVFYDIDVQKRKLKGESWVEICKEIVNSLPQNVYISWDIDGLSPQFCPNTGTPVPGGLDFSEALVLLESLYLAGKKIIGFDLNEVAPAADGSEWDANVGARLLYKLCGWTMVTNGLSPAMRK